ncbi:MAG: hypothetical protein ACREGC_02150, partial [Minisyncoccia bacterium]
YVAEPGVPELLEKEKYMVDVSEDTRNLLENLKNKGHYVIIIDTDKIEESIKIIEKLNNDRTVEFLPKIVLSGEEDMRNEVEKLGAKFVPKNLAAPMEEIKKTLRELFKEPSKE